LPVSTGTLRRAEHPEEIAKITQFAERFIEEGIGQGEARVLLRQLALKFGPLPEPVRARVESTDADTLLLWSERVLSADHLDEVFRASE